jgi:hypothetical protein
LPLLTFGVVRVVRCAKGGEEQTRYCTDHLELFRCSSWNPKFCSVGFCPLFLVFRFRGKSGNVAGRRATLRIYLECRSQGSMAQSWVLFPSFLPLFWHNRLLWVWF